MKSRLNSDNVAYYSLHLSIYYPHTHKTIILPVVLYRCETSSHMKGRTFHHLFKFYKSKYTQKPLDIELVQMRVFGKKVL